MNEYHIERFELRLSGYFYGREEVRFDFNTGLAHYEKTLYPMPLSMDPSEMDVKEFDREALQEKLKHFQFSRWLETYEAEVHDGLQWECVIYFRGRERPKRVYGNNCFPTAEFASISPDSSSFFDKLLRVCNRALKEEVFRF